jgi:enamine deaminase RidA (YjgF/YER057c/UK114 family)
MTSSVQAIEPSTFPWFDYARYTFSLGLRRGHEAWLSGHSASEYDREQRRIVVNGGMSDQARTAYAKVDAILEAADLGRGDVVRIVENVTTAGRDAYAEAAAVRTELFGDRPAVCVTSVDRLLRPTAWLEVEVVAARGAQAHTDTSGARAVDAHGVVYLSGIGGDGPGDDVRAQTVLAIGQLGDRLHAVGLTLADVAHVELAVVARHDSAPALQELAQAFGNEFPALVVRRPEHLLHDDQAVAMTVTATRHSPQRLGGSATGGPAAVRAGSRLWFAGASALVDGPLPRGVVAQCDALYARLLEILDEAGGGPERMLKTIEYVRPDALADYRGVAAVRERLLVAPYPASTGAVCVTNEHPDALLEVAAMALLEE